MPLVRRTLATFLKAELGFFGVTVLTEVQTPLFCGECVSVATLLREFIPLFNAGAVDEKFYTDTLQLEASEFRLIRYPQRGVCLYKCGNERYNLMVTVPDYKAKLFGKAGGR